MSRIAYFVHGRGKGHAVRSQAVLKRLGSEHQQRLYCAGEAFDVLGHLPNAEAVLTCAPGKDMLSAFALRFRADRKRLRRWRPDLVVSDGDGPSVNAARSLGIPVVSVGHGLIFWHTHLNGAVSPRKRLREALNVASSSWPATQRVAVHFAPVEPRTPGTRVARLDLRTAIEPSSAREEFILAYFRDDDGIAALEQLTRRGHRVVLFGRPPRVPRGAEVHAPSMQAFAQALARCRAVAGSAGSQLCAECAMLGLPFLALHRLTDAEHEMNSLLVEAEGIGISAALERCTADVIRRFEAEFEKPRDDLAARTRAMPPASEVVPLAIAEVLQRAAVRGAWKARTV